MKRVTPKTIHFFKTDISGHNDARREIFDIAFPKDINFRVRQIKRIDFKSANVIIGNHYHTRKSRRIEVYVAVGPKGKKLFEFRYRAKGGAVRKKSLSCGDGCLIPPLNTHAFQLTAKGTSLWGLSNLAEYNPEGDVSDVILS